MLASTRRFVRTTGLACAVTMGALAAQKPSSDVPAGAAPMSVFFTTAAGNGEGRVERIVEVPLRAGSEARTIYEGPDAFRIARRLDADSVLVNARGEQPARVDLASGAVTPFLPKVQGRLDVLDIFDGAAIVIRRAWGEAAGQLLVCAPDREEEVLHDAQVYELLGVRREGLWYLVEGSPPEIWTALYKRGTARRIATLPPHCGEAHTIHQVSTALSPGGRLLALGIPPAENTGYELHVVDTISGELVGKMEDVRLDISPLSSSMSRFEMVWLDDTTLRFSETVGDRFAGSFRWVDWNPRKNQRTLEHVYGPMGLDHAKPSPTSLSDPRDLPFQRGAFAWTDKALYRIGDLDRPIAEAGQGGSGQIGTIRVSPDGQWALVQPFGVHEVQLFDATGTARTVGEGWVVRVDFF